MTDAPTHPLRPVAGSFRDPRSRVLERDGAVLRALTPRGLADYEEVSGAPFFRAGLAAGDIVGTGRAEGDDDTQLRALGWAGGLRHERVPFVSYPYEWSWSMLRDAALLHLRLVRGGLDDGVACKDGSAYNVQFVGSRPVFIDVGSFAPGVEEGWPGYRQFCQLFLFPLMVEAYLGASFAPWLRGSIDGIALDDAARLLTGRTRLRRGVLTHVVAQAAVANRYADRSGSGRDPLAGTSAAEVAGGLVTRLERTVDRLPTPERETGWTGYGGRTHYERAALEAKEQMVRQVTASTRRRRIVDIGCNDGRFARIAAAAGAQVVALDADRAVVDRLYRSLRQERTTILPLVADLADPSPALGWALRERQGLPERLTSDLVLSLAVIHHLIIGRAIPADQMFDTLAAMAPEHVIEVPHRADPMVERLLAAKPADAHLEYRRSTLLRLVEERFEVKRSVELPGGTRTLLHARSLAR